MPLSAQGVQNVKSVLNDATSQGKSGAPGLVFIAVDRSGKTLVEHAAGTKSVNSPEPVDLDTTFWIASMTKIVTTIAVLQLVEQKKLALDDPEDVKKYAPEIGKKLVYADGVHGVEQQRDVTLRMLLAHTAGFAYSFIDPRVGLNTAPVGTDEFSGDWEEILESPLVNQPGSMWEYSISLDWAGIILERATGVKLNEYFQQHVFEPLGVEDVTMFPGSDMRGKLAHMHQRDGEGNLEERDHLYRRVFNIRSEEARDRIFHSGGGGLFAKPKEYAKILTALLNDGQSPTTGARILSEETIKLMWENQIPDQPNFARGSPPPAKPLLINQLPEFYPQEGNPPQGWGLSFFLTIAPGFTGRGANTAWWAGLANCYWWVDKEKGVAGVMASQVLPFGDAKIVSTWFAAEKAVYDGLEK